MNRRVIIMLGAVVIVGILALYALQRGPALLLKAPSEERIAFISDRGGCADIWTMRMDGSDKRPVTDDSADDQIPAWSPDGKELAAISDRRNRTYQLFISAWDGRYTRAVTSSEATKDMPVWSADSKEVTFISGGKVYGSNREGGREEQLLPPPGVSDIAMQEKVTYVYGAWSPKHDYLLYMLETDQGRQAYVAEEENIRSYGEEGSSPVGITAAKTLNVRWAPSGTRVAAAFINRNGKNGLLVADPADLSAKTIYIFKQDMGPGKIAWSPDGKTLAFEMWTVEDGAPNRCLGIYAIQASGGKPRLIIRGDAREPSWSPDGRQIVCTVMEEDGRRDIWRVNADGTGAVNLTEGKADNYNPAWSPIPRK